MREGGYPFFFDGSEEEGDDEEEEEHRSRISFNALFFVEASRY